MPSGCPTLLCGSAAEAPLDAATLQDCEFTYLSVQILHLLGVEGPRTKEPARYIRYIYNRIILENATVRAAAVSSLARFGAAAEELRERITILLKRALFDNDDEVRLAPFRQEFGQESAFNAGAVGRQGRGAKAILQNNAVRSMMCGVIWKA